MSETQRGHGSNTWACDVDTHCESPVRAFKMLANDFGRSCRDQRTPEPKERHSDQQLQIFPGESPKNPGKPHNQGANR